MRRLLTLAATVVLFVSAAEARHRSTPSTPTVNFEGTLKSLSSTEIVVTAGTLDVTIKITPDTIFRADDHAIAPADLKPGDEVEIKATVKDNVATALVIQRQNNENHQVEEFDIHGVIKSVSPTQIVVTDAHMHDVTAKITADTIIRKDDHAATIGDLAVGDRAEVKVSVNAGVNTALVIHVEADEQHQNEGDEQHQNENVEVSGPVSAVGTNQITVHTRSGDVVVKTDANTRIQKDDHTIAIGDIHAGDSVEAEGTRVDDHTMLARQIEVGASSGHH